MARWIENPSSKRKLGLASRGHLKTSLWTISDSLRLVVRNPNTRILIINETLENASHFLAKIRSTFERNALFRWLYPDLLPHKNARWHKTELEVNRTVDYPEATIEVMGVGGASTSRHYEVIHEDDLCGKAAADSLLEMQRVIDQHKLAESLLDSPSGYIRTVGTRWHVNDLTAWILENEPGIDYFKLGVFKPGTRETVWPERFTAEHVEALRKKYGPAMFALQYENEAIHEGVTEFRESWLRFWRWGKTRSGQEAVILERPASEGGEVAWLIEDLERVQMVDPCHSPDSGNARTAIVCAGLTPDKPFNIVLLEAFAKKTSPKETVDKTAELHRRWNTVTCGIEIVGAQRAFFYWIPTVYPTLPIRAVKPSTRRSKESRIRGFAPFAEQGRLYIHRSMTDFVEEWVAFPSGRTVDILDALAYLPDIWCPPEGSDGYAPRDDDDEMESYMATGGRSPLTGY
jgi:hypothetical protein